ncbi:PSD1 and planctomycete cytochrome C domain-containing protein [Verrucomicrobiota bacterium sgz303538]
MQRPFPLPSLVFISILTAVIPAFAAEVDTSKLPAPVRTFDFATQIRPILETSCVSCHGAEKQKGHFRIDSREALLKGGDNGAAIVEGKSAESALVHYVARLVEDMEMPPKKEQALKDEQIALLRAWIDAGAPWPQGLTLKAPERPASIASAISAASLPPPTERTVDFVKDIQPIFQGACYDCHGPKKQEAGFRLDHKPTALKGGELGPAITPGKSADSLLVHFVAGLRDEGVMPKKGNRLSAEQIGLLRAWIDQGAPWPDSASVVLKDPRDHWAFKAPVKPAIPQIGNPKSKIENPIDSFVQARLEKESLQPSPEADKGTLLRRLSLDLIGLPPTVQELDTFLSDKSPDAYSRQVERLLSSPHYGERWGRHWLDAARYADSDGYEKDKPRLAHFYRDWVINAFNRDLPYDQFIIEQLAGDQLPNPTQDQIVATGFLRNSMINEEGGVDPEQFRMEAMFDRMDVIGKSVLGLTTACIQCHNHKYDPFTQEEYYKMFAFLNNDHEAQPTVYTPEEQMKRADILRQITEAEVKLKQETPDWETRMARWENELASHPQTEWTLIQPEAEANSASGQRYIHQKDGSILAAGFQPTKHTVKMSVKTDVKNISGFRIEMLKDPGLPAQGPGRSHLGTFALTEFKVEAASAQGEGKKEPIKFAKAAANLEPALETPVHPNFNEKTPVRRVIGPASYAIDGKDDTAWSNDIDPGRRNRECEAVFTAEKPLAGFEGGTELTIYLAQKHGGWNADDLHGNNLGRFRLWITSAAELPDPLPKNVQEILQIPREKRSEAQVAALFSHWRTTVLEWKESNARIDALWKQYPEGVTQMVLTQRDEMRETHMLKRGDWLKPGKAVTAGVPAVLHQLPPNAPPSRLTFAKWLVDPKSSTTARVLVNRVWQAYFGIGIVATPEDFGTQGEAPSHPELLDWLACEFMEKGWSQKELHRLIVHSSTYRQSSRVTPDLLARDPYNRLLARGARFRVEGEIVRDIQLAASGLLNPKVGGRAVMPPAPDFLFKPPASYAPFPWIEETGAERYRRAVYTYRRRTTPYPLLAAFDTPEGNTSCVRRARSNTPLQALVTLNESMSVEAARALARCILDEGGETDTARIDYAFRRVLSRPPIETERAELLKLIEKQRARIADGWLNPWEVATGSAEKTTLPGNTTPTQLATYTVVSRVLLNLDETITKE